MTDNIQEKLDHLREDWGVYPVVSDALPEFQSVTAQNNGLPAQFSTYVDPKVYTALVTPTKSEKVYGVSKRGDWTDNTTQFNAVEYAGTTSAYGDANKEGMVDANANFIFRQSYHFQTFKAWGDRELELMARANLDWLTQKNRAALQVLSKTSNLINLFGVEGLQCYGALNDPNLPAAISPLPKSGGGTTWDSVTDPISIYADILKAFETLVDQTGGNVDLDSPLTLVIPSDYAQVMAYTNQYNVKLREILEENFPNLKIETLPELSPALSGGFSTTKSAQLFVREFEGTPAVSTAFTVKMKEGRIEQYSTFQQQKVIQGSWGTVWTYPAGVVTLTGI